MSSEEKLIQFAAASLAKISVQPVGGGGIEGKKSSLFYSLARACERIEPRYIFLENSPLITSRGLDKVMREVAALGYDATWGTLSAGELGAPHKRDRWWCLCRRQDVTPEESERDLQQLDKRFRQLREYQENSRQYRAGEVCNADGALLERAPQICGALKEKLPRSNYTDTTNGETANPYTTRRKEAIPSRSITEEPQPSSVIGAIGTGWWETEPAVGRLANEFSGRVDAIKGLGNAQVPIVAAIAFYLLLGRYVEYES